MKNIASASAVTGIGALLLTGICAAPTAAAVTTTAPVAKLSVAAPLVPSTPIAQGQIGPYGGSSGYTRWRVCRNVIRRECIHVSGSSRRLCNNKIKKVCRWVRRY